MTDHSAQYSFSFLLPPSSQPIKPNKLLRCYNREGQSLEFVNVIKSSSNAWVALYENKEEKQKKIVKWVGKDSKSVFTKLMHAKKTGVLQYGVEFGWFVCEQPVFVYEYVETLHHTRKNPLAQLDAIDLLDQLIENLCRQHIQGHFVHSDIKPENIGYRVVVDKSKKKEYFFIDWDDSICGKEVFEKQERLVHTQQICVYEPFDLFPSLDALVFVGLWREEILECIVSVLSLVFAHELPDPGKDPAVFRTLVQKRVPCYQMTDAKMLASMSLLEQRIFQALLFIWGYPNGSTLIPQKVWYSRLRSIIRGEVVCSTIEMALAVPRGMKTLEKNKVLASMAYEEQGVGIEYASLDSTLCGRMMQDLLLDTIRIQNEHRFLLAVVHPKHICMCAKNGRFFWSKSTPVTPLGSFGIFGALRSEDIERTLPTDFLYPIFHPAHHSYTTPNLYPRVWQMDLIDIVHMCFWLEKKQLVKDIQTMLIDMVNTKYDTVVASICSYKQSFPVHPSVIKSIFC